MLTLLLIGIGVGVLLLRRAAQARMTWRFLRLRLRPGAAMPVVLDRTLMRVLVVAGGEIWQVAEDDSWALVVAVPSTQAAPLRAALAAHTPEVYISTVAALPWPQPARLVRRAVVGVQPALIGRVVGRGGVVGRLALDDQAGVPLPHPALVMALRVLAPWMARTRGPLLPADLAAVAGCRVLPPPALATTLPPVTGGLPLGVDADGQSIAISYAAGQAVAVIGGPDQTSTALTTIMTESLTRAIALVAWLPRQTADPWLDALDPHLRARLRVVDARRLGETATLDVAHILDDAGLVALVRDLTGLTTTDPALRLLAPTVAAWRAEGGRHLGLLLALLLDPSPSVSAALGWAGADRRGYGQRWATRLAPLLSGSLLALTASPGADLPALLAAGGGLVVIPPDDATTAAALHTVLRHLLAALPAPDRPLLVATHDPARPPLQIPTAMAIWTAPAAPTVPAWHLLVGGTQGSGSPYARLDLHGATVATLTDRWLLLHPRAPFQAWCGPRGWDAGGVAGVSAALSAPIAADATTIPLPPQWADAVQTVLAAWRRAAVVHPNLGTLLTVQPMATSRDDRADVDRVDVVLRVHAAQDALAPALAETGVGALAVRGRAEPVTGGSTLAVTITPQPPGAHPTPALLVADTTDAIYAYPWSALRHLLITDDADGALALEVAAQALATSSPDRVAVTLVGAAPPTWQRLLTTPHALSRPPAAAIPAGLDAVLADQHDPHGDHRTPLVLVRLETPPTLDDQRALMRAITRAADRPLMLIVSAAAVFADLVPFDRYASRLDGTAMTLTMAHEPPRTLRGVAGAGVTDLLAGLPARSASATVLAARAATAVWAVPAVQLAPLPSSLWASATPVPVPTPPAPTPPSLPVAMPPAALPAIPAVPAPVAAPLIMPTLPNDVPAPLPPVGVAPLPVASVPPAPMPAAVPPSVIPLPAPVVPASPAPPVSAPPGMDSGAKPVWTTDTVRAVVTRILQNRRRGLGPRVFAEAFPQIPANAWTWDDVAAVGAWLPGVLVPRVGGTGSWLLAAELVDDAAVWAAVDAALAPMEVFDDALV